MMVGHPIQVDAYNLRNIAFSAKVEKKDHEYDRA